MAERKKTDAKLREERIQRDLKVLTYLFDNTDQFNVGKIESPNKLVMFYAGYTAMRSIWEVRTNGGKISTDDSSLDKGLQNKEGKMIFRVNMEISHSIGINSKTLLRTVTFKYWAKIILNHWGKKEKNLTNLLNGV